MSYTVLAVKWRPRRFAELVGQTDVAKALVNSLTAGRLHHAYLFSGTRGVGKTTIARILAKALNCESGVSAEPCGECAGCAAIDEGRFVDLIEVDAASRTKVDDTRELLDNVQYMPTRGRFKVYLIDEVHMLSTHSFNALLKTLEEPPPHVKFLFATTDPQKLPVTVLSRCLQFNLKKLSPRLIVERLTEIAAAEGIEAETKALDLLAKAADGSMRDALSLLDQAIAFGGGALEADDVAEMLGSIDRNQVRTILEALAAGDGNTLIDQTDELDAHGRDFGAVLDELMGALQRIAVLQLVDGREPAEAAAWQPLAESLGVEDVQLYYQIALAGRRDMAVCRDERMSFEMTLLRMLAFRPAAETGKAAAPGAGSRPESKNRRRRTGRGGAKGAANGEAAQRGAGERDGAAPRAAARRKAESPDEPSEAPVDDWPALIRAAGLSGAVRNLADHCELADSAGDRLQLVLVPDKANFNTDQVRKRLQTALREHTGRPLRIEIRVGEPPRATPAQKQRASEDDRMRRTREAIEQDPNTRAIQAAFDAVVEPDSIRPAKPNT